MKELLRKIYVRASEYKGKLVLSLVLAVLGSLLTALCPQFTRLLVDAVSEGVAGTVNWNKVIMYTLLASGVLLSGCAVSYIQNFMLSNVSQYMGRKLRDEISRKIDRIPLSYFDTHPLGDVLSRITSDLNVMITAMTNNLSAFISTVISVASSLVLMFMMDVPMAAAIVIWTGTFIAAAKMLAGRSRKYFAEVQALTGELNSQAEEVFNGLLVVKAFNGEREVKKVFSESSRSLYRASVRAQILTGLMNQIMNVNSLGSQLLIVLACSYLIISGYGNMSLGIMLAFMSYARLLAGSLLNASQTVSMFQPAIVSAQRIFELLEHEEMAEDVSRDYELPAVKGDVEFSGVKFGYVPERIVIDGFSAEVKAGQKAAIVGPTGAGKSTVINLLMRFYELNGGQILLDGIPIDRLSRKELHRHIGIVPQEVWTFSGTIRDNIIYSTENATEERLEEVLDESGLRYFIDAMPDGLNTVITETSSLSSGQKQLITIARAMIKNAPVLILDEATSSVDTLTEKVIQASLDKLMKGRTSFVIAHRLSTIKNADVIFVMKDGNIAETGTHESLLRQNGIYADLYNSQFADGEKE